MIDWANYKVDAAGYCVSTYAALSAEADTLLAHASASPAEDIFGEVVTVAAERQSAAAMLRAMAARLQTLADELDGPVVDERSRHSIGWDAAHSVAV